MGAAIGKKENKQVRNSILNREINRALWVNLFLKFKYIAFYEILEFKRILSFSLNILVEN